MRKKALMMILVAGFFVFATNAFALAPGTLFEFSDTASYPGATNTWIHTLENTDFVPNLDGTEPLIITSANDALNFTFTPAELTIAGLSPFYAEIQVLTLDDYYTGATFTYASLSSDQVTTNWSAVITESGALKSIADKTAGMKFHAVYGTLNSVNSSILSGAGVVAPEPVSMLLVGIGMVGMPFARRFRRLIKR